MFVAVLFSVLLLSPSHHGGDDGFDASSNDAPPAVLVGGGRSVSVRDGVGGLQRLTSIPSSSRFATYRSGTRPTCTFIADRDGFRLSTGEIVDRGTVVVSHYVFVEGFHVPFDLPPAQLPDDFAGIDTLGPLATATRTFSVFCDGTFYDVNQLGVISVAYTDVLFTPFSQLTRLRNSLQLDRPVVFTNPVVDIYGGLVTRYPVWLAINDSAWRTQRSPAVIYRGATLMLIAEPRQLDFTIDFDPNPTKPSSPFHGPITCIPDLTTDPGAGAGGGIVPAMPELAELSEPGPNGPCMWTPPGPGTLTITAQITYTITFWVNGYTTTDTDYVWSSTPTTYPTGELTAVNTTP